MKYLLAFLFILSSTSAVAASITTTPEKLTVVKVLLPDDTVEVKACSYSNIGTVHELEYCVPQLEDMNLTIQDFDFPDAFVKQVRQLGFFGLMIAAVLVPYSLPIAAGLSLAGATGSVSAGIHHFTIGELEEAVHKKNLIRGKSLVFVFETEEKRVKFLDRVRYIVNKKRIAAPLF